MRVKRYIVDTMPDAMLKIRNELGSDAVILSTKEMKIGGFLGMFQKKKIEVVAAVEDHVSSPRANIPRSITTSTGQAATTRHAVPEAYRKTAQMTTPTPNKTEIGLDQPPPIPVRENEAVKKWEETINKSLVEHSSDHNPALQVRSELHSVDATHNLKEEKLIEEIREMKQWLSQLAKKQSGEVELPETLEFIKRRMLEHEISTELIDIWIDEVYQEWVDSNRTLTDDQLEEHVRQKLSSFLENRVGKGIADNTRIVYIAGPTGVGKTTTIAKIAADQIFRVRKKVGFVTADTYRISAVEQLRTYASILNVPIEVVQSPGDVQRALQRLQDCDLILMDTAGRNYLNEIHVAELHSLLSPSRESETYLVLSLTSKSQDMKKITEQFSRYGLEKVIFTKLDETESVGPMFNLMNEYPLKLSYITNGQNVPDDLLLSNQDLLIDMIMGDSGHE